MVKDNKIFISAIVISSLASAAVLGFLVTQLFFMCFGKSKKVKKKSQTGGGGETSGAQPVVRGNQDDHDMSVITTATVNDHSDDIHDGNIDSGCLDGGALKTSEIELEVNHSADKLVEVAKKDSCEEDEEDLGGFSNNCGNNKTLFSNSCEMEEDVNRSTAGDFDGNDTNKNNPDEKNMKSCGSSASGKLNTACQLTGVATDILGEQNNGAASANVVEEVGERHEVVPGLGDNTETRPESDESGEDNDNKMNICRMEKEPLEFSAQKIRKSENVVVNCVGSDYSQTATKLKNNGAGRIQDCGVISNDSGFNDTDGENVNSCHVQQVTENGNSHDRESSSGIEEDNGLNPKNSQPSIDMAKETKASESSGCEGSDDPDSINQDNVPRGSTPSNSDEDFQRSVERATTVVTMNGTCQDGHVHIDHGRSSVPAMKDVSIQVFDENWILASSSSSEASQTTMSGCSSNGDRGGDKGPGSKENPSIAQRILSSIVHLFSYCV